MNGTSAPAVVPPQPLHITPAEVVSEFSHHHPSVARINNGGFGCCPSSLISFQRQIQMQWLRQPDEFFFNQIQPGMLRSRNVIKDLINADHVDEVSIVDNASTAVSIVLQHMAWEFAEGRFHPGDATVMFHCAYGSVKKSVEAYFVRAGGSVIEVPLPFPLNSDDEIVQEFRQALEKAKQNNRRVRLAILDHVAFMPSVVIPVKQLVTICREAGVDHIFIDGAHGIGCVDVDMKQIEADFYTSNLHKWMFCPPSAAFLYCRRSNESSGLHHLVVTHEYGNGLGRESTWIGTRDYSAQLVVPKVLEFVNRFEGGIDGIKRRNHDGVVEMGMMLAKAWGTHLGCPPHMCSSMVMVGLPACLGVLSDEHTWKLRTYLRDKFGVEVSIYYREPKDGEVGPLTGYTRISYQVYNKVDDYYKFRDAINQLVHDAFTCASLPNSYG